MKLLSRVLSLLSVRVRRSNHACLHPPLNGTPRRNVRAGSKSLSLSKSLSKSLSLSLSLSWSKSLSRSLSKSLSKSSPLHDAGALFINASTNVVSFFFASGDDIPFSTALWSRAAPSLLDKSSRIAASRRFASAGFLKRAPSSEPARRRCPHPRRLPGKNPAWTCSPLDH